MTARTRQRFARAPRRPVSAAPWVRAEIEKRLVADPRFRSLPTRARYCLLVAVQRYVGADGRFWPKVATWAEQAGVSRSTVERAIRDAVKVGLVEREPYLRPDGRQGATTYLLDFAIVYGRSETSSVRSDAPCLVDGRAVTVDEATSSVSGEGATSSVSREAPDQRPTSNVVGEEGEEDHALGKTTNGRDLAAETDGFLAAFPSRQREQGT